MAKKKREPEPEILNATQHLVRGVMQAPTTGRPSKNAIPRIRGRSSARSTEPNYSGFRRAGQGAAGQSTEPNYVDYRRHGSGQGLSAPNYVSAVTPAPQAAEPNVIPEEVLRMLPVSQLQALAEAGNDTAAEILTEGAEEGADADQQPGPEVLTTTPMVAGLQVQVTHHPKPGAQKAAAARPMPGSPGQVQTIEELEAAAAGGDQNAKAMLEQLRDDERNPDDDDDQGQDQKPNDDTPPKGRRRNR